MQETISKTNIIITEPSRGIRIFGRLSLSGKWKEAVIAACIYLLCLRIPQVLLDMLCTGQIGIMQTAKIRYFEVYIPFGSIYILVAAGALTLGFTLFFLSLFRGQRIWSTDVFLGFLHFGKATALMLFQSLFVILWSLVFIVPGVIAAIRYSQAFFILADDPDKGIRQCMDESKNMMRGNKGKLFCLTLSFIGWQLLSLLAFCLPVMAVTAISFALPEVNIWVWPLIITLIVAVGLLLFAPVTAYMYATYAAFYEMLTGHLSEDQECGDENEGSEKNIENRDEKTESLKEEKKEEDGVNKTNGTDDQV